MKTDKEMAHDWYIKHSESPSFMSTEIKMAWEYADAMQAEVNKREKEKAINEAESHKEFMSSLSGQISCWSCGALVKLTHRSQNDGCCPNCNVEIEL